LKRFKAKVLLPGEPALSEAKGVRSGFLGERKIYGKRKNIRSSFSL
jgi:hypothetical protein